MDFKNLVIQPVPVNVAEQLISRHHYSRVMPALTRLCYGGFIDTKLVAVVTLGWGTRPLHTIKKIFPELSTQDYFELGKMCLVNDLPRNSESYFLSKIITRLRIEHPEKKILFTWADGIVGKPGYVYQASNFLYGGFIWTDTYFSAQGEKIHPRTSRAIMNLNPDETRKARPSLVQLNKAGITHYQGKQFRYIMPLMSGRQWKLLAKASPFEWSTNYPKASDLEWKRKLVDGTWEFCQIPTFTNNHYRFNKVKPVADAVQGLLF